MSQFYLIVGITILSPYLNLLLPWISRIGLLLLVVWIITGILNSSFEYTPTVKRFGLNLQSYKKRKETIGDYTEFLDSSLPMERLQKSILEGINEIVVRGCQKLSPNIQVPTEHLKSVNRFSLQISQGFVDAKEDHLEQRVWVGVLQEILRFIRVFKKLRKEVLKENVSSVQRKNLDMDLGQESHLEEYMSQDEQVEWEENVSPLKDLDELLLQISAKFKKGGFMHPAIGSKEREQAYIRLLMDQVFYKLGWREKPGNRLMMLLLREAIGCYGIWNLIDKWSQPEILNNFILDKAIKRYIAQASVKSFRAQLQMHFIQFPPKLLRKNQKNVATSLASKYRYFEGLAKYAKKSTCLIDLKAMHHQISVEIRTKLQEASEITNKKSDSFETLKKYLKALDQVKLKFEKRISLLSVEDEKIVLDRKKSLRIKYRPLISLRSLLDEYLAGGDSTGAEASSSLFYFLEFMDQEGAISLIRFWMDATNLRKIYSQWTFPTSLENSDKIQEEIQKIYKVYSTCTFYGLNDALKAVEIFSLTQLPENLREACLAIFKCQGLVYDDLLIHFNQFLDSDHYFRLASELQRTESAGDVMSSSNSNLLSFGAEKLPPSQNSIILNQLELQLERESLRLTGSKNDKDKEARETSDFVLFNAIDEVMDLDALEGDIPDENQNESILFSGLDSQNSELLHSSTKLQEIKEDLDRKQQQIDVLNILLQKRHSLKAPTAAQMMQIHILEQSQAIIRQEMNDLSLEKVKYQSQEQKEAILPGLCMVRISRATESIRDHKRVTYYEILIDKENGLRKWAVRRRYNDFLLLHRKLKENYPIVHEFDLPGKNFSMFHSKIEREDLKQERMHALEKYLQRLIDNPLICQSEDLRTFLSSAEYKERRLYNTVKSIMHSDEGSHYNLKSGAQKFVQLVGNAKKKLLIGKEDVLVSEKSLNVQKTPDISADDETSEDPDGDWGLSNEEQTDEESSSSQGSLSGPLCSVLVELFDFKEQDYYLKKTSSAMLMKQYFGGRMSLESEIAGILANYMTEDVVCKILSRASFDRLFGAEPIKRNVFKSDDNLKSSQENVTRNEMKSKLFSVWPESFTRFLGPDATQTGVSRMLDLIQSSILNRHLIFTILDSIVETILEE